MFTFFVRLNSYFLTFGLLLLIAACRTENGQFISPEEANTNIYVALALKDQECGTGHSLTWFIYEEARKSDVELCVDSIIAETCSSWSASTTLPNACLAIQIDL